MAWHLAFFADYINNNENWCGDYLFVAKKMILAEIQGSKMKKRGNTAYCVKCKARRVMKDVHEATTANGRHMKKGICSKCGTKMAKFVKG